MTWARKKFIVCFARTNVVLATIQMDMFCEN